MGYLPEATADDEVGQKSGDVANGQPASCGPRRKCLSLLPSIGDPKPNRLPFPSLWAFYSGVSAQIGSGVVRGGPEASFHEGSTRVPPGFHQGSTRVPRGFHEGCKVVRALKRAPHAVGDIK